MKRIAAALVLVLALAGCAVTGQPANPDTAATFDGVTVTNDEVAQWVDTFNSLRAPADPSAVVTLLLLKPTIDKAAADAGILYTDDELTFEAKKWIAARSGKQVPITDDMREAVRLVRTLKALLFGNGNEAAPLAEAVARMETDVVASPMYGTFTFQRFSDSINEAAQAEKDESNLADVSYLVYKDVSGFSPVAPQPWMVDPEPTRAPAAAAPVATPAPTPSAAS